MQRNTRLYIMCLEKIFEASYYLCNYRFAKSLRLQLHGAIYRLYKVLMLRYCANLKTIRYELTSLNRIVADKSLCVIVALRPLSREREMFGSHLRSCIKRLFNCIQTQGIHPRMKTFMFPIQLIPTECLLGERA